VILFVARIFHISIFKNENSQATWSRELLGKFSKKLLHFEEFVFEIAKNFGGFGDFLNLF
jgi:hypothetical protein